MSLSVESRSNSGIALHQIDILPELLSDFLRQGRVQSRIIGTIDFLNVTGHIVSALPPRVPLTLAQGALSKHLATLEISAHANRPARRGHIKGQRLFDFIEKVKWVSTLPVQFVDEGDNWDVTQTADLEKLSSLSLNSLCCIDDHYG